MWVVVARRLLPTRKLCLCVPTCSIMVPVLAIASPCWTSEGGIPERKGQRSSLGRSLVPSINHLGNISAAPSIPMWISLLNLVRRDHILWVAVHCSVDVLLVFVFLGRYFACSTHALAVNVFGKRAVNTDDGRPSFMYYVNDGIYGSFNCIMFDHQSVVPKLLHVSFNYLYTVVFT